MEGLEFVNVIERDRTFLALEKSLREKSQRRLQSLRSRRRPQICVLEAKLVNALIKSGFIQVFTPIILSRGSLEKMNISQDHSLSRQVFWIEKNKCLRPMLAPNLYYLLRELVELWEKPIRIFEVGPCFRKDTGGRHHLNEFTMLNLVELGLPSEKCEERLKELASNLMAAAGVKSYRIVEEKSEVYGKTFDIVSGIEVASGALGPHPLDTQWKITDPWVGIGFGLERLVMVKENYRNIQRAGRALVYLDGVRLNI